MIQFSQGNIDLPLRQWKQVNYPVITICAGNHTSISIISCGANMLFQFLLYIYDIIVLRIFLTCSGHIVTLYLLICLYTTGQ